VQVGQPVNGTDIITAFDHSAEILGESYAYVLHLNVTPSSPLYLVQVGQPVNGTDIIPAFDHSVEILGDKAILVYPQSTGEAGNGTPDEGQGVKYRQVSESRVVKQGGGQEEEGEGEAWILGT
jgi:hypothetical protein